MDRALDEVIGEGGQKPDRGGRGNRGGRRRHDWPRDDNRKNTHGDRHGIDDDWIHDKYDDNENPDGRRNRAPRNRRRERDSPDRDQDPGTKLRVENLHYELTEDDLDDLFSRIGTIKGLVLTYDRAGRSTGTAYVTYRSLDDARSAVREFDGANAKGQPIRLAIVPNGPGGGGGGGGGRGGRNPFDSAVRPGRSLFDRVEEGRRAGDSRSRNRSRSPRRSDVSKPAPDNIDRYVPGERDRSRSPRRRREGGGGGGFGRGGGGGGGGGGRNDSRRGENSRRGGRRDGEGHSGGARPRKTQEELDREMDDYWTKKEEAPTGAAANTDHVTAAAIVANADDVDMAE